jgi:hypothetical protein
MPRSRRRLAEFEDHVIHASEGDFWMRRLLLAAVALGGLIALTTGGASAAPSAAGVHVAPSQPLVTNVDYYYHHRHWHHRHWEHNHWRYW